LLLYAAHQAMRALALRFSVLRSNLLGLGDALAIRLAGEAIQSLTVTGPLLAEPTRAWLLTRRGLTLTEGLAATIGEYLMSSFVTAGLAIASLGCFVEYFQPSPNVAKVALGLVGLLSAFLVVSAVAIRRRFYLIGAIIASLVRIGVLRGRWRPDTPSIHRMEDLLLALLHDRPGRLATVMSIEAAAQALLVLELFWLLQVLDLPASWSSAFVIEGSMKIIGVVFLFIPLQVGVAEGAYALIFDAMGLPPAAGFAVAFLRRIRTITVAGIGLVALTLSTREPQTR
jgi:hypothetical protein